MYDGLDPIPDEVVDRVRGWIDESERVTVLTGAGISTDSGIPDYRGPKGTWTRNPKAEKLAHISHYLNDPEVRRLAWRNRLDAPIWGAEPNLGHAALVDLQKRGKLHALLTQNVDGLHQAAGTDPDLVVEVHGTVHEVQCWDCGDRGPMQPTLDRVRAGEDDPRCLDCGGILKSATISFGQNLVAEDLDRAEQAAIQADLLLTVGSTLAVGPINAVVPIARRHGARIVILNGSPTEMDSLAHEVLVGAIGDVLPRLVRPLRNTRPAG